MSREQQPAVPAAARRRLAIVTLAISLFTSGCATVRIGTVATVAAGALVAYRVVPNLWWQSQYRGSNAVVPPDSTYELHFVEVNDQGNFYDSTQAENSIASIQRTLKDHDVIVLLYIHGWHNNAQQRNHDVNAFRAVLHGTSRLVGTYSGNTKIVGIYVGWRGRAMPWLADYTTFFGRKDAAQRVGRGELRTVLYRLQRTYDEHAYSDSTQRFMGLVTIGHSFGGQALFEATRQTLEEQLYYRAGGSARTGASQRPAGRRIGMSARADSIVRGIGDVTFLINPAVEAGAFDIIDRAYRRDAYDPWQTPALVVIDGSADMTRRLWFPFGRAFTVFGTRQRGRSWSESVSALGVYDGQVTHDLKLVHPEFYPRVSNDTTQADVAGIGFEGGKVSAEFRSLAVAAVKVPYTHDTIDTTRLEDAEYLRTLDLANPLELAGDSLSWRSTPVANSPVLVIRTDDQITGGHSDVFRPQLVVFLSRYIRAIEAKVVLRTIAYRERRMRRAAE